MMDQENGALIGLFRAAHDFEKPFGRSELFWVMPELPRWNFFEWNIASPAKFAQRVQANRIQRLDAAILKSGQSAEFADMKFAILLRREDRDDFRGEERHQEPWEEFEKEFHTEASPVCSPSPPRGG